MARVRVRPGLLKRLREIRNIPSETQQAKLMGVDRTTLHRVDRGGTPSGAFIAALCETFDLGIGEAFEIVSTSNTQTSKDNPCPLQ